MLYDTICNPIDQEYMDKLNIPPALSENFPSQIQHTVGTMFAQQTNLQSDWTWIFGQA